MKTIEEMRAAVCKHCDSVCPRDGVPTKIDIGSLVFGYVVDEHDNDFESWFVWLPGLSAPMALWSMADDGVWLAAYRLFNLGSSELEARNAALVTTLETMRENAKSLQMDSDTFRTWIFDAADYRLKQSGKGGSHEG
jgi:hypothetical protein